MKNIIDLYNLKMEKTDIKEVNHLTTSIWEWQITITSLFSSMQCIIYETGANDGPSIETVLGIFALGTDIFNYEEEEYCKEKLVTPETYDRLLKEAKDFYSLFGSQENYNNAVKRIIND